ncbi:hypothetical protein Aduo_006880 [Ancylostoma duodenale]
MKLLESDNEEEAGPSLEINKNYAERYDNWRRLEELQKIKDKYGDDVEDTSSSEEEPEWSAADEMHFLRTLSALKGNDASIYDEKSDFWQDDDDKLSKQRPKKKKQEKQKPMYLKDYERKLVLEKGGQIDESDEEDEQKDGNYFEQQEQIRKALRQAVQSQDSDDDEDSDDLLVPKQKTEEEQAQEDEDFYAWMKTREGDEIGENDDLKGLKEAWKNPDIDENEKFLRDYLVNKDFIPDVEDHMVTLDDLREIEEDEKDLDRQRDFEHKYNFRFEEPDQEFIKQYPRTVGESLRKTNSKRKEKREEYKERKEREKRERKQEIRELKKMKKAEIEKKLERLKKMAGDDIPISIDDLEGDFDPKEYDMRMQQIFNEEYYGKNEEALEEDMEKPVFSDMDDIDDGASDSSDYDNFPISTGNDEAEDLDEPATAEQNGAVKQNGEGTSARAKEDSRRKKKRNSKFREAMRRKKPVFDPNEKTFEEYFNEYYALDYEDIIGDNLTRFKYRQVVPNDFGLSVGEILSADDRQLNAWASLKKATGYRSEHEEIVEKKRYEKKAADLKKKEKIFSTDFGGKKSKKMKEQEVIENEVTEEPIDIGDVKKKKKKKKKGSNEQPSEENVQQANNKENMTHDQITPETNGEQPKRAKRNRKRKAEVKEVPVFVAPSVSESPSEQPKRKKKKRVHSTEKEAKELNIDDDRLRAYGLNPKKFKNKLKFGKKKSQKVE